DVGARLFACLADGGGRHQFAAIDESSWKHPFAVAGLDGATDQDDLVIAVADDGANRDLRILIEDESAARADQTIGFALLDRAQLQVGSAKRAMAIRALVVRQHAVVVPTFRPEQSRSQAD